MADTGILAFAGTAFVAVAALIPITNPPGNAPIFLALTEGLSETERESIARRVAMNCLMMMVGALVVGSHILEFFGISLSVVRVAGGLLVVATAWRMLQAEGGPTTDASTASRSLTAQEVAGRAFYPLSFPITVGPGSIATAITLGASLPTKGVIAVTTAAAASILGLAIVALAIYFAFRYASQLVRRLGATGTAVFLRLSAFILLCIGVQICWDGLSELLAPWKPH